MKGKKAGITIIELLMVIVITGIIATIAIPQFVDFTDGAKTAVTQSRLNELSAAILGDARIVDGSSFTQLGYLKNIGAVPTSLNDLAVQGGFPAYDPFTKRGWRGPYVNTSDPNWNKDGWGTSFSYDAAARTIRSCGPNKVCGNADDIVVNF